MVYLQKCHVHAENYSSTIKKWAVPYFQTDQTDPHGPTFDRRSSEVFYSNIIFFDGVKACADYVERQR